MERIYSKSVKTRKIHLCHHCLRLIPIGRIAEVATTVDGGDICRTYGCEECEAFLKTKEGRQESLDAQSSGDGLYEGWVNEYRISQDLPPLPQTIV